MNQLSGQKSLYLKQHAENPIHWWPYGLEPLNKAKEQNKLILLSIGYSSCHWCHVMSHESFENPATAEYLNQHFVAIKVDREEYPDLDNYYQNVCSLMTGRGGWPLNVLLTPEGKPFFVGTYFPAQARQGMPSFQEVLKHFQDLKNSGNSLIYDNAQKIAQEMIQSHKPDRSIEFAGHFPAPSGIMNALKNFQDEVNGGYGKAPKFPHFPFYEWACEQILEGMIPKEQGQHIVESVERMLMGGLYDHVKGGIHRYSVDDKFLVPHFEKMLYDQAGLIKVLAKLGQFYPAPVVFDGLMQTLDYLKTEMLSDSGFFFSAQDADSEGQEGLYFTFSQEEFENIFDEAPEHLKQKKATFLKYFNITVSGNFEHGLNVISLNPELKQEFYTQEGWQEIREVRQLLLEQRKLRLPPATDHKGIAGWNFMLISALTDVIQYCPIDVIRNQAVELVRTTIEGCLKEFIHLNPKTNKNIIRHTNTLEQPTLYLEDYVFFCEAQLRLHEISGNEIFKNNFLDTLDFITQEFIQDHMVYITSKQNSTPGIDNLVAPAFDQSYRSALMSLVGLLERGALFNSKFNPAQVLGESLLIDLKQFVLQNPFGHGEGLRAMTYPPEIYKKIEVPMSWIESADFQEMRSHFFGRFVLTYHQEDNDTFQICNQQACEVQGKGWEHFKSLFTLRDQANGA